jgi:hypothetical protein
VLLSIDRAADEKIAAQRLHKAGGPVGESLRADARDAMPAVRRLDPNWDGALPTTYVIDAQGKLTLTQRGLTDLTQVDQELGRIATGSRRIKRRNGR